MHPLHLASFNGLKGVVRAAWALAIEEERHDASDGHL